MLKRLLLAMPLCVLLWLLQVPPTLAAEMGAALHAAAASGRVAPLMVWSRFLMGGGGALLALWFAGLVIWGAARAGSHPGVRPGRDVTDSPGAHPCH